MIIDGTKRPPGVWDPAVVVKKTYHVVTKIKYCREDSLIAPSMSARITPPSVLKKSVVYVSNVPFGHVNAKVTTASSSCAGKQCFYGFDALRADNHKKAEEVAIEKKQTSKTFKGFVLMYFLRMTPIKL